MEDKKTCIICGNEAHHRLTKLGNDYYQCWSCRTLFSGPIDQEGMVGGEHEEGRNIEQNHLRINRVNEMTLGLKKEDVHILDFGCGHGMFVSDLKKAGYANAVGYDAYNDYYSRLPETNKFSIVTMTEVIEHISHPFAELKWIHKALVPGGCLMIETSFVNIAEQENIPLSDFFYIAPQNGHCTIFSHHGLDLLMALYGFIPRQHFNRHVRLYQKISK